MMCHLALERVRRANTQLRAWLVDAREALAGRGNPIKDLSAVAEPVAEMQPIVSAVDHLRACQPELRSELAAYAENLGELETVLERVRFALLARLEQTGAERAHLEAVGLWAAAWRNTR